MNHRSGICFDDLDCRIVWKVFIQGHISMHAKNHMRPFGLGLEIIKYFLQDLCGVHKCVISVSLGDIWGNWFTLLQNRKERGYVSFLRGAPSVAAEVLSCLLQ